MGLDGEDFSASFLSSSDAARKRRGRPFLIADTKLFPRRQELLGIFELHWAEFAWILSECRTLAALSEALKSLAHCEVMAPYFAVGVKAAKGELAECRDLCAGLKRLLPEYARRVGERRVRRDRCQQASNESPTEKKLQKLLAEREQSYALAVKEQKELQARLDKSEQRYSQLQAYFAKSELLDFLQSKRYTLTPLHLANALAGVPEIGWRSSAQRCGARKPSHPHKFQYELFMEVKKALGVTPPKNAKLALPVMRAYLKDKRRRSRATVNSLCAEWYYLRVATETAYTAKPLCRAALPYRIFAEYRCRASARSAYDLIMEEEGRL